ncbi:MAG: protein-L-isoaspartate(D-aspartate) O-methyltransferase [Gammaproteobacteria bacterium]|nr:protein-L-isoaspartate(D-aspartate) O-methyltransferase [Gammaproteobacteria bacterium]
MMPHRGIGMTSQRTRERLVQRLEEQGIRHPGVLDAIRHTPRHLFVDEALASRAYEDTALPISYGQTISQPYIVARMTEVLLEAEPDKVLEIGTGSGYQAAILARLVSEVHTVERIEALKKQARKRFAELKLRNIHVKQDDGVLGWPEHAPYDAIIVTAASAEVPAALLAQLSTGGRMLIPVGAPGAQDLLLITRTPQGYERRSLERVSFVPLLSGVA